MDRVSTVSGVRILFISKIQCFFYTENNSMVASANKKVDTQRLTPVLPDSRQVLLVHTTGSATKENIFRGLQSTNKSNCLTFYLLADLLIPSPIKFV